MMVGHGGGFGLRQGWRMTLYQTFQEASFVFHALQNARRDAAADKFPDRSQPPRRASAGHAVGVPWPQGPDRFRRAARDMRVFAAGKLADVSPGAAISA